MKRNLLVNVLSRLLKWETKRNVRKVENGIENTIELTLKWVCRQEQNKEKNIYILYKDNKTGFSISTLNSSSWKWSSTSWKTLNKWNKKGKRMLVTFQFINIQGVWRIFSHFCQWQTNDKLFPSCIFIHPSFNLLFRQASHQNGIFQHSVFIIFVSMFPCLTWN